MKSDSESHFVQLPLPLRLLAFGGRVATFSAKPYAPWKELLSRIRKAPGSIPFNAAIAMESGFVRHLLVATCIATLVSVLTGLCLAKIFTCQ